MISLVNPHLYHLNPYSIPLLIIGVLSLIVGCFLIFENSSLRYNWCVLYICFCVFIWQMCEALMLNSLYLENTFVFGRVFFIPFVLLPAGIYHLSIILTNKNYRQRWWIVFVYTEAVLLSILSFKEGILTGFISTFYGFYPMVGPLVVFFVLFIVQCFMLSFLNFTHYHIFQIGKSQRRQTRFFMITFLALLLSFYDLILCYDPLQGYPFGYIGLLGFIMSVLFYKIRMTAQVYSQREGIYKNEIAIKSDEFSKVFNELGSAQLKLMESGKISALASLSAGILHQMSQPITAIHGFVKFIKTEMNEQDKFYRPICLIEEQSLYIKQMLNNLMELIRHREIRKELININEVMTKAVNLLKDELRIRRVLWELELGEALPTVNADATHLQQIFMNIIINAIQAVSQLPRGEERRLTISSEFNKEENMIYISFQDNGPGIAQEDKNQVFEPFFSKNGSGSGIGLSFCRDILTEHHGKIRVESRVNDGANFIISLPCEAGETT